MTTPLEMVIAPRARDLGGFSVRRALPYVKKRAVGPFVFLDEMGPAAFAPGQGIDVRPHPHVCLATVTFLFDGEITHRDTTGAYQSIRPGDLNWMHAGRGIAHSERTGADVRAAGHRLHGLQAWVALPEDAEETDPSFQHHPAATLPQLAPADGVRATLIAGAAYGAASPVAVASPLFYVDTHLEAGAAIPAPDDHEARAAYVVTGVVELGGERVEAGSLAVIAPGAAARLRAVDGPAHIMLLGGAPLGERFMEWNFVASTRARVDQAKADWIASEKNGWNGPFTLPAGDDHEFIPLPDAPTPHEPVEPTADCPTT